jgi:hypothetical protein
MSKILTQVIIIKVTLLLCIMGTSLTAFASQKIKVCIPDHSVPPFYIIDKTKVSGIGAEHLQQLFKQPALLSLQLAFVLQPWKRCILNLK